jgi:hypothetical protein
MSQADVALQEVNPHISKLRKVIATYHESLVPVPENISAYDLLLENLAYFESQASQLFEDLSTVEQNLKAEIDTEDHDKTI